ncbi:MAG: hypothetical protein BroJett024_41480 [Alphaproteobacteria bacterium]|nr:MAG: hypothetical protein BroJett024_41480 [Alphaproteobacteria bacterium]
MNAIARLIAHRDASTYRPGMTFRASKLEPWQLEAARRLAELVSESGLRQEHLAERLGVASTGQISQMLTGKRPISIVHAAKFAASLGCRVDDFSIELADQIRSLAAMVKWPENSAKIWPFMTRPSDYERLSPQYKREIAQHLEERVLLTDMKSSDPAAPDADEQAPRRGRRKRAA